MLQIVALPIGNKDDITLRAIQALKNAEVIIGEERKELIPLLKMLEVDIHSKKIEFLNEHSKKEDVQELGVLCKNQTVCLVSDCGTPVFCDPGSLLIDYCRKNNIEVKTLPGASSLMGLLSLSAQRLEKFYFYGFLPREKEERMRELKKLSQTKDPFIVMDTPYRLIQTLEQLALAMPLRKALLATDLTQETEKVVEGTLKFIATQFKDEKKEFLVLVY